MHDYYLYVRRKTKKHIYKSLLKQNKIIFAIASILTINTLAR